MAGKFTVIPQDTFNALQLDAGVLLTHFDPANPVAPTDEDIICATTGGINASCVPTYSDLGSDVDNVPVNMKELKHLDSWEAKLSTNCLGTSPRLIRMSLGAADIDNLDETKIVPRADLSQEDFTDLWWVGDKANGGFVAVQLKNALSTGGFSLQTTKNGKGQVKLDLTGHVSINKQKEVPMVFYSSDEGEVTQPDITLSRSNVSVEVNDTITIKVTTNPVGETVTWSSSDTDKATVANGVITGKAAGTAVITASITVDGIAYTDTCNVTVTSTGA